MSSTQQQQQYRILFNFLFTSSSRHCFFFAFFYIIFVNTKFRFLSFVFSRLVENVEEEEHNFITFLSFESSTT